MPAKLYLCIRRWDVDWKRLIWLRKLSYWWINLEWICKSYIFNDEYCDLSIVRSVAVQMVENRQEDRNLKKDRSEFRDAVVELRMNYNNLMHGQKMKVLD